MNKDLIEKYGNDGKLQSPKLAEGLKNFLIDIDGTVSEDIPNEEPERMITCKEIPGAREFVNKLYDEGHIITFFTSRLEEHRAVTEQWLKEHGFKWHGIVFGKPRGGNYHWIDDSGIQATWFKGEFTDLIVGEKKLQDIQ